MKEAIKESSRFTAQCQSKYCRWLRVKTGNLSANSKLTICMICCLGFGTYCGWLVVGGFTGRVTNTFGISQIRMPGYIGKTGATTKTLISDQEYQKVTAYLDYLDDLKTSRQGLAVYDSLLSLRPGLKDSLLMVHRMYLRQH
jgi:hypothetical protein